MKKHLIINAAISIGALGLLCLASLINYSLSIHYYLMVLIFWTLYSIQAVMIFKLGHKPSSFSLVYNISTVIKMMILLLFLVLYYMLYSSSQTNLDKIQFTGTFLALYFFYLIINTRVFFQTPHETKK